jgi:predicted HAD superfamily Cof-like phosphohydrolase
MRYEYLDVTEFHFKHRFPIGIAPGQDPKTDLVRLHLISEELAELALAIADQDDVRLADALGDLIYVVLGTAVTYGIPIGPVFDEIQRANMTKAVRSDGDTRLRDKGNSFVPPDIAGVLKTFPPERSCPNADL